MFDLATLRPAYATTLQTPDVTAMQGLYLDDHDNIWITQPTVETSGSSQETTILARLNPEGALLDYMHITAGGHGVGFAIEYDGGNPMVYWRWQYSTEQELTKFTYRPGESIAYNDLSVARVCDGPFTFFTVNAASNLVTVRDAASGGVAVCHLYLWSDIKNNVRNELKTVNIPSSVRKTHTFQGAIGDYRYCYELTGIPNGDQPTIHRYDWDAKTDSPVPIDLSVIDGAEPEGLALGVDQLGASIMFVSISGGGRTNRTQTLVVFNQASSAAYTGMFRLKLNNPPFAAAYLRNSVEFPDSTYQRMPYDTHTDIDPRIPWDAQTNTFTINEPGLYIATITAMWGNNLTGGHRYARLQLGNSALVRAQGIFTPADIATCNATQLFRVNQPKSQLWVECYHDAGTNLNMTGNTNKLNSISIARLSM